MRTKAPRASPPPEVRRHSPPRGRDVVYGIPLWTRATAGRSNSLWFGANTPNHMSFMRPMRGYVDRPPPRRSPR
jgi:hypothetical protein